ncbi:LysR family transcriptional regulator [Actinosynnema sp. NPDC047251]|uniref:Transcriptional regulator, LysR family n=1 Tax=Saccharothrix espanaensis (strain ATCC 51144 / DSM 44229 / JCM 9112 / NBRC 15066 / NRRL 15764) TaxID=1179773 RepID=K0K145_SACES|nr:LysR family transcriptional regulator [Saccharothrix espanaensis]CCH33955.1 Transcriptional regulator, LysR family [Saccharothrix espanaensis DSM 44229]
MLNPVHLRTLVEVVATGSFAAAARRLGYTSSAVSQQVSAFERAVGTPLFEREAHSIRPSSAALFIAERGAELLAALDGFEDEIAGLVGGRRGRVRLGTFPTASARVVPHAVARLAAERPDAEIQLDEGEPDDLLPQVLAGSLDLALVYAYDLVPRTWPEELTVSPLLDEALLIMVPGNHPANRAQIRVEDLRDERWICSRDGTAGATCAVRLCAAHGFTPRISFRSNDYGLVRGLVRAGVGVAMVPALGFQPTAGVAGRPMRGKPLWRHVFAVHRTANANPLLRDALAALGSACDQVVGEHLTRA